MKHGIYVNKRYDKYLHFDGRWWYWDHDYDESHEVVISDSSDLRLLVDGEFDPEAEVWIDNIPDNLPKVLTEITHYIPEHQMLLSFNDDDPAEKFSDWWFSEGKDSFSKWSEKNV